MTKLPNKSTLRRWPLCGIFEGDEVLHAVYYIHHYISSCSWAPVALGQCQGLGTIKKDSISNF